MSDDRNLGTAAQRHLEELQRHLEGATRRLSMDRPPEINNTFDVQRHIIELLPYVAAMALFILIGAATVFGPEPKFSKRETKLPTSTVETQKASAPEKSRSSAGTATPKIEPWTDTVAAFQRAVADKRASDDETERLKLIEQFRERLNTNEAR
jgi:hypothetical protein